MLNQTEINTICNTMLQDAMQDLKTCKKPIFGRLYNCQAQIIHCDTFTILQSYNTYVAVFYDDTVYDCLRTVYGYTATSAQHISKFMKYMGATRHLIAR